MVGRVVGVVVGCSGRWMVLALVPVIEDGDDDHHYHPVPENHHMSYNGNRNRPGSSLGLGPAFWPS